MTNRWGLALFKKLLSLFDSNLLKHTRYISLMNPLSFVFGPGCKAKKTSLMPARS